jgi:hypothetical protein
MRKLLLLLTAALFLPMAMNAQALNVEKASGLLHRANTLRMMDNRHKAPAKADLGPNQRILGHYDTDDVVTGGYLGLTGFPGDLPTAIELTPDELAMFQGGKIVAFRVGLAQSTNISRVFVAPSSEAGFGEFTEWACDANAEGWNVIPIDPPYEINLDSNTGLFVGYDYRQTSTNYPISAVDVGDIYPTYMYLTYQGSTGWYDLGLDSYGNLSLQLIVESDDYPDYSIRMSKFKTPNFVNMGDDVEFTFNVRNYGLLDVDANALAIDVFVDGEKVQTITNPEAFGSNDYSMSGTVSTQGLETGEHHLTLTLATLNGEPIENPSSVEGVFKIITGSFPRQKHLIEELTSNTCTYCPLGASMLHYLLDMREDIAMVCVHGNQSGVDPSNTAQCDSIFDLVGAQGWPYAVFDRSVGWEDDSNIACGIGYNEQYHQMVAEELSAFLDYLADETPTFATIELNGTTDMETRKLQLEVHGDITPDFDVMMGEDAKLTVYLTEDGLIYRQLNQGKWVSDYVHNHVLRLAVGSVKGVALNKVGDNKYSNTFEVEIPAEWNIDNMDVVAFISRPIMNGASGVYTDMYVNNANSVSLKDLAAGVEELLIDEDAVPVEYYDVMGRMHDTPQQGINIVKMSNGSVKKVLVK